MHAGINGACYRGGKQVAGRRRIYEVNFDLFGKERKGKESTTGRRINPFDCLTLRENLFIRVRALKTRRFLNSLWK